MHKRLYRTIAPVGFAPVGFVQEGFPLPSREILPQVLSSNRPAIPISSPIF